ncbi:hypothetical protein ACFQL3_07765 [Natronoarchaeum sp. GCM10025321]|uniref:hypothetical protein n=2 Tax=unclassified Natronoarchaeum TaxID=2620183 RepID=UPI00362147C4
MNRRTLLVSVGAVLAGTAGCTDLESSLDEAGDRLGGDSGPDRPWGELPVTVSLDDRTDGGRQGFEALLVEGMEYWEARSEEFAGYGIEYAFDPDRDDTDVIVELVENVQTCSVDGHNREAVGCAPVIVGDAPDTATIEIKDGFSDELTLTTIKHEFGHTLGLGHDDDPVEIMSDDPGDRIPDYDLRVEIHERYRETVEQINEGTDRYQRGTELLGDLEWAEAVEPFEEASEHYNTARDALTEMREDAESIDAHRAVALLGETESFANLYGDAAESYALMAAARADENFAEARGHREDANEAVGAALEYDVEVGYSLAEALGLQ